jgi:type IV secretory pathway protease TraF
MIMWQRWGWQAKCCVVGLGLFGGLFLGTRWCRLNVEPSVPRGLYRLHAVPETLERGHLVVLPVPEALWPWHSRWVPLLKPVAGIGGDRVCYDGQAVWVGQAVYGGVVPQLRQAFPLRDGACYPIPQGWIFLASPQPRSIDSRYLGPVPQEAVTAVATPVWVWE